MVYCKSSRKRGKKWQICQQYILTWIILCETHRFLWAGLDGGHVGYLGLTHNCVRDHTLDVKLDNLNWDIVLVGDVDEILGEETHSWSGASNPPFFLSLKRLRELCPSHNCSSYLQSVMWMQFRQLLVDGVLTRTIKTWWPPEVQIQIFKTLQCIYVYIYSSFIHYFYSISINIMLLFIVSNAFLFLKGIVWHFGTHTYSLSCRE